MILANRKKSRIGSTHLKLRIIAHVTLISLNDKHGELNGDLNLLGPAESNKRDNSGLFVKCGKWLVSKHGLNCWGSMNPRELLVRM